MVITTSVETLDELWLYIVCWVELPEQMRLCLIFCENMDPDK